MARFNPGLEALHNDLLTTVPGLTDIVREFDTLSWVGKREFIKVVENAGSAPSLALFLELHATHAIQDDTISTVGVKCDELRDVEMSCSSFKQDGVYDNKADLNSVEQGPKPETIGAPIDNKTKPLEVVTHGNDNNSIGNNDTVSVASANGFWVSVL